MTAVAGAALSLRIVVAGDGCRVSVQPLGQASPTEFEGQLGTARLQALNAKFRKRLAALESRQTGGGLRQSDASAAVAMKDLFLLGQELMMLLFGDAGSMVHAVELCRQALLPQAGKPFWDQTAPVPPLVSVATRTADAIPVEFLPLLEIRRWNTAPDAADLPSLGQEALRFLGFAALVERRPLRGARASAGAGRRLQGREAIGVGWLRNATLPSRSATEDFLARHRGRFACMAPWPNRDTPRQPGPLAEALAGIFTQPARPETAQLLYVHCHCETSADDADRHSLHFHTGSLVGGGRVVTKGVLDEALRPILLDAAAGGDNHDRPLIFMNACGSAVVTPSGLGSFPELFADPRFLGFIGTEAAVPDAFAAAFGERLLTRLAIDMPALPLGRAIHRTRWDMLRDHRNPLGLLYTAYADSDIEVTPAMPKTVSSSTSA